MRVYDRTTSQGMGIMAMMLMIIPVTSAIPLIYGGMRTFRSPVMTGMVVAPFVFGAYLIARSRMRVWIEQDALHWSLGFGIPRYRIPLSDIASTRIVKNDRLYGFGVSSIARGKIYNVGGATLVEVVRVDETRVLLATDDERLKAAIDSARGVPA